MSRLPAGKLRQRVDIMRKTTVDNNRGGSATSWAAVGTAIPAEVIMLIGSEAVQEKVLRGIRVYQVTIRWRAGLQPKDQLRYNGDDLNIRSAIDPDSRRERLVIVADTEGAMKTA